jgi:flagellar FliL protein
MRLLIPLILALVGLAAGAGAGLVLRPEPAPVSEPLGEADGAASDAANPFRRSDAPDGPGPREYVKLNNQFIVPLVEQGRVNAMVIMALSVEVAPGQAAQVYAHEPKLRDAVLQVMFEHANAGGFRGSFTESSNMRLLRQSLREAVRGVLGAAASDVLITEIVRQDT